MGEFGAMRFHHQLDWILAPVFDVGPGVRYPVLERIRFGETRPIPLQSSPPDILVGVGVERLAPGVYRVCEVSGLPERRVITHPQHHSQSKPVNRIITPLCGSGRRAHCLTDAVCSSPQGK